MNTVVPQGLDVYVGEYYLGFKAISSGLGEECTVFGYDAVAAECKIGG